MDASTLCPYCGHDFAKVLSRGQNCPACRGAIKMRKPFPYTLADTDVHRVAMTVAQAVEQSEKWDARQRQQFIEANGFDHRDRAQRHAMFRAWFLKNMDHARRHPDAVAVEIIPSPRPPCTHACVGLWDIHDHPIVPPDDCPNDYCLCHSKIVFRDELKGRKIAGWRTYEGDDDGKNN